jgi:hypothetical protein
VDEVIIPSIVVVVGERVTTHGIGRPLVLVCHWLESKKLMISRSSGNAAAAAAGHGPLEISEPLDVDVRRQNWTIIS